MNGVKNKSGLTTIASTLIIIGLVVAIGIVFIIIYNIISSEIEYSTESNISLQIEKSSVVIDENNKVSLKISRDAGDAELEKIKFVLFDGENIEEIEKKASELEESSEMSFSFTPKLVTNIKTISVVPIIKVAGKRKYLAVANSIQITKQETGSPIIETPTTICGNAKQEAGEQCDDGNLKSGDGCSSSCKTEMSINQTITTTPSLNTTALCGDGTCQSSESCSTCSKDCGACPVNCGNSVINSPEQCDAGSSNGVVCSASYGTNCTYCSSSCINTTIQGASCGDNTCNSPTETSTNCLGDCPLCVAGQTQQCGATLIDIGECNIGIQTCSAQKTWGACTGEIAAVAENTGTTCSDAKDNDCDALIDCADSNCNGQTCATGKVCSSGSCVTALKANGQSCTAGTECSLGNCIDGVCCNTACSGTCQTCSSGTCSNIPVGTDPAEECADYTCANYISGWSGTSCLKYSSATANNGMCNGAGVCYSVTQSCTGSGTASASCGSAGCKSACPAGGLATSYDSASEVCHTSGQGSCDLYSQCNANSNCVAIPPTTCGDLSLNPGDWCSGNTVGDLFTTEQSTCKTHCQNLGAGCCQYWYNSNEQKWQCHPTSGLKTDSTANSWAAICA